MLVADVWGASDSAGHGTSTRARVSYPSVLTQPKYLSGILRPCLQVTHECMSPGAVAHGAQRQRGGSTGRFWALRETSRSGSDPRKSNLDRQGVTREARGVRGRAADGGTAAARTVDRHLFPIQQFEKVELKPIDAKLLAEGAQLVSSLHHLGC